MLVLEEVTLNDATTVNIIMIQPLLTFNSVLYEFHKQLTAGWLNWPRHRTGNSVVTSSSLGRRAVE